MMASTEGDHIAMLAQHSALRGSRVS